MIPKVLSLILSLALATNTFSSEKNNPFFKKADPDEVGSALAEAALKAEKKVGYFYDASSRKAIRCESKKNDCWGYHGELYQFCMESKNYGHSSQICQELYTAMSAWMTENGKWGSITSSELSSETFWKNFGGSYVSAVSHSLLGFNNVR